jgi:hypothetical protein
MHETAGLGDAAPLHDGFPGAWDDLVHVVGDRRLGLRGRHGFMLVMRDEECLVERRQLGVLVTLFARLGRCG